MDKSVEQELHNKLFKSVYGREQEPIDKEAHKELMKLNKKVKNQLLKGTISSDLFTDIQYLNSNELSDFIINHPVAWLDRAFSAKDEIVGSGLSVDWHITIKTFKTNQDYNYRFKMNFVDIHWRDLIRGMLGMSDDDGYLDPDDRSTVKQLEQFRERACRELRFITEIHAVTEVEVLDAISYTVYTARCNLLKIFDEITNIPCEKQNERNSTTSNLIKDAFGTLTYSLIQLDSTKSLADIRLEEDDDCRDTTDKLLAGIW